MSGRGALLTQKPAPPLQAIEPSASLRSSPFAHSSKRNLYVFVLLANAKSATRTGCRGRGRFRARRPGRTRVRRPQAVTGFVGLFGAIPGPLSGIMIADRSPVKRQVVTPADLDTMAPDGAFHYTRGWNEKAVAVSGTSVPGLCALLLADDRALAAAPARN